VGNDKGLGEYKTEPLGGKTDILKVCDQGIEVRGERQKKMSRKKEGVLLGEQELKEIQATSRRNSH